MNDAKYRIERLGQTPATEIEPTINFEWCLIRNHDDEVMSIWQSKSSAQAALREANLNSNGTVWEGHEFGKWYGWPQQVPTSKGIYIVAYGEKVYAAIFTPSNGPKRGRWNDGIHGHSTTNYVTAWMPMPNHPNDLHDEQALNNEEQK